MEKLPLSVAIITYNEEVNLPRTLEAIKDFAAEIIVVDSHSTDRTVEIAKKFGAKVFVEDWKGYREQKNSALKKCTQKWILSLDADEVITPQLKQEIEHIISNPKAQGYFINRRTVFLGKPLRFALYPDKQLRLVLASANPQWTGGSVHELLKIKGKTARLKGYVLHYSYKDLNDFYHRLNKYAYLWAQDALHRGLQPGLRRVILSPLMAFVKNYFLKFGFLDGMRGLIIARAMAYYSSQKAFFLWELYKTKKSNN